MISTTSLKCQEPNETTHVIIKRASCVLRYSNVWNVVEHWIGKALKLIKGMLKMPSMKAAAICQCWHCWHR